MYSNTIKLPRGLVHERRPAQHDRIFYLAVKHPQNSIRNRQCYSIRSSSGIELLVIKS